jgi:hypothetical protein
MSVIKNILVVDDIQYLVEFISYRDQSIKTKKEFLMFRQYEIENDIAYDNNIYFVSDDDFESEYKDSENWPNQQKIIWPTHFENLNVYHKDIFKFCENSYKETLVYNNQKNRDWYRLYDKDGNIKSIYCDEIRIYKPHNRNKIDLIIDVTNIVNDINVHYFCQLSNHQYSYSEKEIIINNNIYSEYVSFFVPNVDELFGKDNLYFIEDLNISLLNNELIINNKGVQLFPLYLLFEQFSITSNGENHTKNYFDYDDNSQYNYKNVPINVILTSYTGYNEEFKYFEDGENKGSGCASILEDNYFRISSKIGFDDDGIISLINVFDYLDKNLSLLDAYCKYNKINKKEYILYNPDNLKIDELITNELPGETLANQVNNEIDDYDEDEWDGFYTNVKFKKCGYFIQIASDITFENIIFKSQFIKPVITDFAFSLNDIFYGWHQYPGSLFVRAFFIDKYCSQIFVGNPVVITKEHFKYCINNIGLFRLNSLKEKNNDMNIDNFNFINNVTCVVKNSDNAETNNLGNFSNKSHVLYKPIFYKVQDSQNISIRKNVTQNIGINLGDYLTKVEAFRLKIDTYDFYEVARNDVFVLFEINANFIKDNYGVYDITNQDDEYIMSGKYNLY